MLRKRAFELRFEKDSDSISGVAIRYGDIAQLPWGRESIEAGALSFDDVILNLQHIRAMPLARTPETLKIEDDSESMRFTAKIPKTNAGNDCRELVKEKILRGCSLEFLVEESRFEKDCEIITKGTVVGIAICDTGAYKDSVVDSMKRHRAEKQKPPPKKRRFVV